MPAWDKAVNVFVGFARLIRWAIIAFVLGAVGVSMFADVALGYPILLKNNYPTCGACHVAPGGGGVVTGYGRDAGAGLLATYKKKYEEMPIGGYVRNLPDWLYVGGNQRYINANVWSEQYDAHQKFLMQADVELAVKPTEGVTIAATAGVYGPEQKKEFRRHYMKLAIGEHVSLRGGRFIANYGVNAPDHTLPTRQLLGLGQGQETYNVEGHLMTPYGEATITGVYGGEAQVSLAAREGYGVRTDSRHGVVARGAVFAGDRAQLGVSYLGLASKVTGSYRQAFGGHAIIGFTESLYLWADASRVFEDGRTFDVYAGRAGWEVWRGVHLSLVGDGVNRAPKGGVQLQLFPRPHYELLAEWKRTAYGPPVDTGVLMFNHYL